jgi:DNA-binding response OmpR family regulator
VVDDTPEALGLLTDMLDGAGYTVLIATDGESALRLVDQITPDLVLMDASCRGWMLRDLPPPRRRRHLRICRSSS